ncbi:hypothetical protein DGI_0147 [Megalodesulfovibrio gigas DSM 1382 = ATCC 19364]|uniref:Uncharacterized protein n=1 Tax=Megalodesulfovibrio gigas (strain ATCC 19364 / DSM 1382 / NCIMB 9332 / VKM B-1759) TaxID=1121448 RepID=T2G7D1_MEGG1|nr:hypothetical protein DGI_0147 [Megalodesulfovibrio gigas DSM 1382 = ATCC 19364]
MTLAGWRRGLERRRVWAMVEDLFRTGPQELRLARGWTVRLALACQVASERVAAVTAGLGAVHVFARSQWQTDAAVNAVFATPDAMDAFLRSPEAGLCRFFETQPVREVFFALTASPDRRAGFGARMHGEVLLRDERIETLTFREHRLLELHGDPESTRSGLCRAGLRYLVSSALHHVIQEKMHRKDLAETRAVLATKHKALSLQLKAMHGLMGETKESRATLEELGRLVAELDHDLEQADVTLGHPEDMLREVDGFLRVPRRFLGVRQVQVRVTRDGEVLPPETAVASSTAEVAGIGDEGWRLEFTEFDPTDGRPPRAVLLGAALREDVMGRA